jgi:acetyltransferase
VPDPHIGVQEASYDEEDTGANHSGKRDDASSTDAPGTPFAIRSPTKAFPSFAQKGPIMMVRTLPDAPVTLPPRGKHPLDVLVAPESVAVFGATEAPGSLGRALMSNLILNPFGGVLFPISTRRRSVLGVKAFTSLAALPHPVELAIVATPAATVPDVLEKCLAAEVKAAIVLSGGFGECGSAGAAVERQIRERLRGGGMRVLGMNSFGIACPRTGLNATCSPAMFPPGNVGFLSQSGALLMALLNQELSERVGCSTAISVGSLINISWAEWLDYLARDPQTACIAIYMEQLDDARAFFATAREVAAAKPILLIKSGRNGPEGRQGDEVFDEACRSNGVLRVARTADLFRVAAHLTTQPAPKGRRLAIVTNARGPATLAADDLCSAGAELIGLAPQTVAELSGVLTPRWDRQNPIDVSDSDASRFTRAAAIVANDPSTDALLVLLAPQAPMDPVRAAGGVCEVARESGKPVLACWMWGAANPESLAVLREGGIPTFHSPEAAIRVLGYLRRHSENLRFLGELREALADPREGPSDKGVPAPGLVRAYQGGRGTLQEAEVRELFSAYHLPVKQVCQADTEIEAMQAADGLGYPVGIELASLDALDPEGEIIRLKAVDAEAVRRAVRVLHLVAREHFGMVTPPVKLQPFVPPTAVAMAVSITASEGMWPVVRLGEGGRAGEAPRHAISALAPLTLLAVREMIEQGPVQAALHSGGKQVEGAALAELLLQMSRLTNEQPQIKEITINPLLVWEDRVLPGHVRIHLRERYAGAEGGGDGS